MTRERRNPRSVDIDLFPTERVLKIINAEDASVTGIVATAIPEIAKLVDLAIAAIRAGGRVLYVGAGSSGRIAVLDAAECPSTFSTPPEWVQAVIAGGTRAFAKAAEGLEDDRDKAIADLKAKKPSSNDLVIAIAASGTTPYTLAALQFAAESGAKTAALVCVEGSPLTKHAALTVCAPVGAEVLTGSTRMKAGTAQKLILNMFSTALMIRLGMTYSNWMINVAISNEKLRDRARRIVEEILGVQPEEAAALVAASGANLKVAVTMGALGCDRQEAERRLGSANWNLRTVVGHMGSGRE